MPVFPGCHAHQKLGMHHYKVCLPFLREVSENLKRPKSAVFRCPTLAGVGLHAVGGMLNNKAVERRTGIEPAFRAWEARVLPLYDRRMIAGLFPAARQWCCLLVDCRNRN